MIKVNKFARVLDKDKKQPNFIEKCIRLNQCREFITKVSHMNQKEKAFYAELIDRHEENYNRQEVWGPLLK